MNVTAAVIKNAEKNKHDVVPYVMTCIDPIMSKHYFKKMLKIYLKVTKLNQINTKYLVSKYIKYV